MEGHMSSTAETRAVVETYFRAWTSNDVKTAYAQLAPDLAFTGPTGSYRTAEEFLQPLIRFAAMTKSATVVELVVDGDRAALLYDCELAPIGVVRIASFFRVEGGTIRAYDTRFDATEFRSLQR
jgi:hypothetical protein